MPASHRFLHTIPAHEIRTQKAAIALGVASLALGVLGFVPYITTHYEAMGIAGRDSEAMLLGTFVVSIVHNLLHVAVGTTGLVLARTFDDARRFLVGGGLMYLALFGYGVVVVRGGWANILPINDADNWLHLGLAVAMIALGLGLSRSRNDTGHRALSAHG